jgi:hypothetical protein
MKTFSCYRCKKRFKNDFWCYVFSYEKNRYKRVCEKCLDDLKTKSTQNAIGLDFYYKEKSL